MKLKAIACMAAAAAAGVMGWGTVLADAPAAGDKDLTPNVLAPAVKTFLADHGDLCLAWYTWPREVTEEDRQSHSSESVQMPVLERLGIVKLNEVPVPKTGNAASKAVDLVSSVSSSSQATPSAPTWRYSLTTEGLKYYQQKKHVVLNVHSEPEEHGADFCVAHLTLDKVIRWSPPEAVKDHLETTVRYTYHVKAAPFMSDPEVQKVFPMVDRIIRGEGRLEMTVTARKQDDGKWVPVLPGQ